MIKYTSITLENYLHELSSEKAVPGGGSVSACVASMAMGLTQMVGRIALNRKAKQGLSPEEAKKEAENRETIEKIIVSLEKTKRDAFQIVNIDPQVYLEVMKVWAEPEKLETALKNSFRLQADLAFVIVMADEWNTLLAGMVKGSIKNDLLVSAALLEGAFRGACHTALINSHYMKDENEKKKSETALQELKARFRKGRPNSSEHG